MKLENSWSFILFSYSFKILTLLIPIHSLQWLSERVEVGFLEQPVGNIIEDESHGVLRH
jgi:hypothetical protein